MDRFATCGIKALVLLDDEVLVLRKDKWVETTGVTWNDLPGGRVDFGEPTPEVVLRRELMEELGCSNFEIGRPVHMATVMMSDELHVMATVYTCFVPSKEIQLSSEHSDFAWLRIGEAASVVAPWIADALKLYQQNIEGATR